MNFLLKSNKAFTLVELLMAVGIIAIMTGIAIPNYLTKIREQELKNGAQQVLTDIRRTSVKSQTSIEGTGWFVKTTTSTGNYSIYKCSDPSTSIFTDTLKPDTLKFIASTNLFFEKNTGVLLTSQCVSGNLNAPVSITIKHTTISKCTVINVSSSGTISYDETNAIVPCT